MTDIDRQSLRDFMATEVMGWHDYVTFWGIPHNTEPPKVMCTKEDTSFGPGWRPDLDSNQLDMLIDKMVEDGFNYEMNEWADGFGNEVVFHRPKDNAIGRISNFKDRRLAMLLAIKAAKEAK